MRATDDDRVRPPLSGVTSPTDPRDGRATQVAEREAEDPRTKEMLAKIAVNGYQEAGGDDVIFADLAYLDDGELDFAENGDAYLAVGRDYGAFAEAIDVYRSTDDGESWTQIGSFDSAGNDYERLYELDVVEGTVSRVYITYTFFDSSQGGFDMRVAYADIGTSSPTWTVRTVMDEPGVSFLGPDLTSDVRGFQSFYLYAVCAGLDGNGDDIWFSRSTDQGDTWSAPYRVESLSSSGNLMYSGPQIAYGAGGELHLAYRYTERLQSTFDDGLRYRKAVNYAASSSDWISPRWALTPTDDGEDVYVGAVDAGPGGDDVSILYVTLDSFNPRIFGSTDGGDSWSLANRIDLPFVRARDLLWDHDGERLLVAGSVDGGAETHDRIAFAEAPLSDPKDFSPPKWMGEYSFWSSGYPSIAVHPTRNPDVALCYTGNTPGADYQMAFDAEWRGGPGHPNYEAGFPVEIPGGGSGQRTAPALVDVDQDGELEIVFGNRDGTIYVIEPDGSVAPGWPVDVGDLGSRHSPVAVGDLNGDGVPSIVAGTADGRVVALAPDGSTRPGFPVDLGTAATTYVAIGAVGPPYPRWIVALSGTEEARINWRGSVELKSGTLGGTHVGPPAIGDVDGDGDTEIVYAFDVSPGGMGVHVLNGDFSGGVQEFRGFAENASDAVSLGDLDLDGDLEITVPTTSGRMYVLHHDLSDVTGFPFDSPTGTPLTRAAIDQFLGTFEPELAFAARNYDVHVLYSDGVQQSSFPGETTTGWYLFGAPIVTSVDSPYGTWVVLGSRDRMLWSFRNVGATQADGWPKDVDDPIEVTPAAGDMDADGSNEIVFLGNSQLHVVDVSVAPNSGNEWWTMEGADPARTGCANCSEDLATAVDDVLPRGDGLSMRIASGNPSFGQAEFAFRMVSPGTAELALYDLRGRRVRMILRRELAGGEHHIAFDGRDDRGAPVARGSYVARLTVRDGEGARRAHRRLLWLE